VNKYSTTNNLTKGPIGPLTEGPIGRQLMALALPIVLANSVQTSYQLINTFWLGRLGADAVAAVSVSFPIIFLLVSLGGGLTIAGSILVAQYSGARDYAKVNHVSGQTLLMVLTVSLALSVVGFFAVPTMLRWMGVSAAVFADAVSYMRVSFSGIVFVFAFAMYQSIMRGIGETRMPLYVVSASVVLNLVLDPILIYGWGPIPAMHVAGAAYATLITQAMAAALGMYLLFSARFGLELKRRDLLPDWPLLRRVFRLGLPASIEQSMQALGMTMITMLVSTFGTLDIAAFGLGIRVLTFVIIPAFGISMAASTLVAQCIGAGNRQRAEQVAVYSVWVSLLLLGSIGVLFYFGATPIVRFFVPDDPALIEAGTVVLRFTAMSFVFSGIQLGLAGTFRGAGDTFITMLLAAIGVWCVQLPIAYVLSKHTELGAMGIWWMFPIAGFINTLFALAYFKWGRWRSIRLTDAQKLQTRVSEEILIEEGSS
jgi:putative MATE family efflux protein